MRSKKKFFPVEHHFSKTRFYEIMRHRVTRAVSAGKITEKKKTEIMRNLKEIWEGLIEAENSWGITQMRKASVLASAFHWHETPQGVEYWLDVSTSLKRRTK